MNGGFSLLAGSRAARDDAGARRNCAMPLQGIDHFTVNVRDLDASVRFYEDVLGLSNGPRPDLGFPGAWIYCGDQAILHLVGGRAPPEGARSGAFDHIALSARDREAVCRRLAEHGVPFDA